MPEASDDSIVFSLYAYLWGKFKDFGKPLSIEQQTELDGLLSDIAYETAIKFIASEVVVNELLSALRAIQALLPEDTQMKLETLVKRRGWELHNIVETLIAKASSQAQPAPRVR